jgi:hypothetical protein
MTEFFGGQENLTDRFWPVLKGHEDLGMERFVTAYRWQFEDALRDLLACAQCEGNCRTVLFVRGGTPMYLALDGESVRNNPAGTPVFKAFYCPGVEKRKEILRRRLAGVGGN